LKNPRNLPVFNAPTARVAGKPVSRAQSQAVTEGAGAGAGAGDGNNGILDRSPDAHIHCIGQLHGPSQLTV